MYVICNGHTILMLSVEFVNVVHSSMNVAEVGTATCVHWRLSARHVVSPL